MKEKSFNKIVFICVDEKFSQKVGKKISSHLEMMFCDAQDMVEYELIDRNALIQVSTKDYMDAAEEKVYRHIADFENVLINMGYDGFIHHHELFTKNSLLVLLQIPQSLMDKKQIINLLAFQSRTQRLEKMVDAVVKLENLNLKDACNKIYETLGGIL